MRGMSEPTKPVEAKRPDSRINWVAWIIVLAVGVVFTAAAVIGVTVYDDFTYRAQNSEAYSLLQSARVSLIEEFQENRKWPDNLDKIVSSTSGTHTKSVAITRGAGGTGEIELTATMRTDGPEQRIAGKTILLVSSDGGKNWTCRPGTMPKEYVPPNCRNN